jgi:hypothetical protein
MVACSLSYKNNACHFYTFHQYLADEIYTHKSHWFKYTTDENQQAPWKDPLGVLIGLITRPRAKKIKEAVLSLIFFLIYSFKLTNITFDPTIRLD